MSDLLAARSQMALSLAFHIVFAMIGIAMPVLMVVAERRWRRTGNPIDLELAKRWSRGTAILFAVGAVSGTVLSFELGLLWPRFMEFAGPLIGLPFSLEGFAFFTEAIFLGIYLYGWERVSPRAHLAAGIVVAIAGTTSGIFVVIANAWMNTPAGLTMAGGEVVQFSPLAAMANPAALSQTVHMTLAAFAATGLGVAGIHAFVLLRHPADAFHRRALTIALLVGAPAALLQPLSGDLSARHIARYQPMKLAAAEALFETRTEAPLLIGGWPDAGSRTVRFGIEIPAGLSLLAFHDPHAEVAGLDQVPERDWPPVAVVHLAFQAMVGLGSYMALVSLASLWLMFRRRDLPSRRWLLRALVLAAPMGFIAAEAGWVVTEVGRQPWVIQGIMRTADAVTPMPGLIVPMLGFLALYLGLAAAVIWLISRQVMSTAPAPGVTEPA
ncbi:MAG: cytochrome ubiquinol oxidase subunit I [Gemmatimonadales bacterium]